MLNFTGIEILCIFNVIYFCIEPYPDNVYFQFEKDFRKFTYNELKKATRKFSEATGRGSGGGVFKRVLSDNRVAAIK